MDFLFGPVIRSKTNEKSTLEDSYHHSQDLVLSWLILRYFITESVCSSTSVQKLNGFTIFKSLFFPSLEETERVLFNHCALTTRNRVHIKEDR